MPKLSIVVPVYQVEPYLRECLDSLSSQTLEDIEILCVDDASTDGSWPILREAAAHDPRVRVWRHDVNRTAAVCRREGVLASTGDYVLFCDPDDLMAPEACATLWRLAERKRVDVLQFRADAFAPADCDPARVQNVERMLQVQPRRLRGDLLPFCFGPEACFSYQLWNKLWRGDICREAMTSFPEGAFPKAQDLLAVFVLLCHAKSYEAVRTAPLYHYRVGVGVTGGDRLTRRQIDGYAAQALVPAAIDVFLKEHPASASAEACARWIYARLLCDTVSRLKQQIAPEDFAYAWDRFCEAWGQGEIVAELAAQEHLQEEALLPALRTVGLSGHTGPIRCISAFYHSIGNGGAQRVTALLCSLWHSMGYRVVLFTDRAPSPNDYPIPGAVERVVLPAPDHGIDTAATYRERERVLYREVKARGIDLFVHHAWISPTLLWDLLAVRSAGAACWIYCHSVFSAPALNSSGTRALVCSPGIFAMADGLLVLSETDRAYWSHYQPRVVEVRNPLGISPEDVPTSDLAAQEVLWVGRLSNEKRPLDAVEIFRRVHAALPSARLTIVGSGTKQLEAALRRAVEKDGLTGSVELCGFQKDVEPFYRRAAILLCTSQFEGAPLTPVEAQLHGVPVVSYEMPYLTVFSSGKGCVTVRQGGRRAAADAIVHILSEDAYRLELGAEARRNIETLFAVSQREQWERILSLAQTEVPVIACDERARRVLDTFREHAAAGLDSARAYRQPSEAQFVQLPEKGPCRMLRKKLCTFMNIFILQGPRTAWRLCVLKR